MTVGTFAIVSVVTKSHLSFVRALAETTATYAPGAQHFVLLVDSAQIQDVPPAAGNLIFVPLQAVIPDAVERAHLTFQYTALEICCALKPLFARFVLDQHRPAIVVYLDVDMTMHAPFSATHLPDETASFVLTPHHCRANVINFEATYLRFGTFNAGYFAVKNDDSGREILDYWWARCRLHSVFEDRRGLFLDQLWLNQVPVVFGDVVRICRDGGLNVSWWNFGERGLRRAGDAVVTYDGVPLVLMHWSKVVLEIAEDPFPPILGWREACDDETKDVVRHLRAQLAELINKVSPRAGEGPAHYGLSTFSNGATISPLDRKRHLERRQAGDAGLCEPFGDHAWFHVQATRERRRYRVQAGMQRLLGAQLGIQVYDAVMRSLRAVLAGLNGSRARLKHDGGPRRL